MFVFFFFKQKTAYEIGVRLVGSEMCIRDSVIIIPATTAISVVAATPIIKFLFISFPQHETKLKDVVRKMHNVSFNQITLKEL